MSQLGPLRYLYVGSVNVGTDVTFHQEVLGGVLLWRFQRFGAEVAAIRHGKGVPLLLASHRAPGSVLPIYAVDSLRVLRASLAERGLAVGPTLETPDGPCTVLKNESGFVFGALEEKRPGALEDSYREPGNTWAVRDEDS
jgi:hypothetical protein